MKDNKIETSFVPSAATVEGTVNQLSAIPGLVDLWQQTMGDAAINVAVLDGTVAMDHPCFKGADLKSLETIASGNANGVPSHHGTHVTSILFAQEGSEIEGVAPNCRGTIVPIFAELPGGKVVSSSQLDIARAINQAIMAGAHIINISGGKLDTTGEPEGMLAKAIEECVKRKVLIIAAAGNDGCACLHIPAASPVNLAVGAMNAAGEPLDFSNWGTAYQAQGLLAIGENIPGAKPDGGVITRTGTSFATPIVSGIIALLLSWQKKHGMAPNPYHIKEVLLKTSDQCDVESNGDSCQRFLAGRLNLPNAMASLMAELPVGTSEASLEIKDPLKPEDLTPDLNTTTAPTEQEPVAAAIQPSDLSSPTASSATSSHMNQSKSNLIFPNSKIKINMKNLSENHNHEAPVEPQEATTTNRIETPAPNTQEITSPTVEFVPSEAHLDFQPSEIDPSGCGCGGGDKKAEGPKNVYALGTIGFDFVNESRRDSFLGHINGNINDPKVVMEHVKNHPHEATELIWTLEQEGVPIYAIYPHGAFAAETYKTIIEFIDSQLTQGVERVSIPGLIAGNIRLLSGQTVPAIVPTLRGMYSWSTDALVAAVAGGGKAAAKKAHAEGVRNFLERVYYELRNLGVTPHDRAINFSATNAFQPGSAFHKAIDKGMVLADITCEKSPIARPGTDPYDVRLSFFDPKSRYETAKMVFRFTVDVADVIPVSVGKVRSWSEYN